MAKTIYIVDSTVAYETNHANTGILVGVDYSTCWGGVGGIQRALASVVAGDDVLVKTGATINVSLLVKITHGANVGTQFARDDFVIETTDTSDGDPADAGGGQGYVVYVQSTTVTWVHVTAGTFNTTASRYLWKNATTYTGAISAVAVPGLTVVTGGSNVITMVGLIGVNASWVEDGSKVVLDGMGSVTNVLTLANGCDVRNVRGTRATGDGFTGGAFSFIENCTSDNSGAGSGFVAGALYSRCYAYLNGVHGFNVNTQLVLCVALHNTQNGIGSLSRGSGAFGCVAHGNGYAGIVGASYSTLVVGCVLDGNTRQGYSGHSTGGVVLGCRITNNSVGSSTYWGLDGDDSGNYLFEDWNVFYNNSNDATPGTQHRKSNILPRDNSLIAINTTEEGYTDYANHDFNLTTAAILRNTPIELPG